jgi:anti-sigma regulatory factor (Ser/Thr protein kinase)
VATRDTLILPNSFNDSYTFEEILNLQNSLLSDGIKTLDLSQVSFIEPYSMIGLILLGRNHLRNTGMKLSIKNMPLAIHQYLFRMDFFNKGVFTIRDRLDERFFLKRSSLSRSLVEITDIPNKERESIQAITGVISVFRKRARHILKHCINDTIVDYFVTVISELCQNIFEHSLDSGYLSMQTYSYANQQIVRLVISDSGIGIRESFASKPGITFESPAHLIELAATTTISSKREFGYGLNQVNSIVEKLKGSIHIRSENASVSIMYNKKQGSTTHSFLKNGLVPFPGTQISISLAS